MYRYLVFSYNHFYPNGGLSDLDMKTNDLDEAKAMFRSLKDEGCDAIYIYDAKEDKEIDFRGDHR